MNPQQSSNLVAMFLEQAAPQADRAFLWRREERGWTPRSYGDARREMSEVSRGLRALGLRRGDRVVLVAENRPEWILADLAIMAAGAVTVPAYVTHTVDSHRHVLTHSRARAAIVSSPSLLRRLLAAASPMLDFIVCLDPPRGTASSGPELHSWESVRERGRHREDDVESMVGTITRTDPACIQYTSGTGGLPRGAVLSHGAMLTNVEGGRRLVEELGLGEEVFLSFLPASHAYEHTAGQYLPIAVGGQIYYAESAAQVPTALLEARPTILIAVPRLCETMHRKFVLESERKGSVARGLFQATLRLGRAKYARDGRLSTLDRMVDAFLDRVVRDRIRARFGGRLKAIVSGGAPLSPDLVLFFHAVGLRVLQGYGLTEAAPIVCCNPPFRVKIETVGPPLHGVEVRLADDGEILVRGENVMTGYWNDPDATAAAIRDGWLHTGDIGRLDADGYLTITDRKKDFIKTTGGEMIAPQKIEGMLTLEREIAQAVVIGDRRPHLVALIVPDADTLESGTHRPTGNRSPEEVVASPEFQAVIAAAVDRANRRLSPPERVRRFSVLGEPFTVDNDLLTPTLKLRRHRIVDRYGDAIERLYDGREGRASS